MMFAAAPGPLPGIAGQTASKSLKVFILAGQSNMQGHANVEANYDCWLRFLEFAEHHLNK